MIGCPGHGRVFVSSSLPRTRPLVKGKRSTVRVRNRLHLQYNPATKVITGKGEAQNLRIATSNFTETVLEGSFFDGDKGVLILQQSGGLTDGAVRKYVMERKRDGSLSGIYDEQKTRVTINLTKQ